MKTKEAKKNSKSLFLKDVKQNGEWKKKGKTAPWRSDRKPERDNLSHVKDRAAAETGRRRRALEGQERGFACVSSVAWQLGERLGSTPNAAC